MRKRCRRTPLPRMPRWLRPRLDREQLRDLALAHVVNLDDVATGRAGADVLWQMAGGVLTWSRVAELLDVGRDEMAAQLVTMQSVIDRFKRTGRVGFSGAEYQTAKDGVAVMDQLAELTDLDTARVAADWSEDCVNRMVAAWQRSQAGAGVSA